MKISKKEFDKIPIKQRNGIYEIEGLAIYYYVKGKLHRENKPAFERYDGYKAWYINNKYHRLDGPAVETSYGNMEYWIKGKKYPTREEFELAVYMYKNRLMDYL